MLASYSPGSLPEVTSAEVVALEHIEPTPEGFMEAAGRAPRFVVEGKMAQRLADLWRLLPPGDQARCHIQTFGLRFFLGNQRVCEASLCWLCNNIHGESFVYEFDAQAVASRQLLAEVQKVAGM